MFCLINGSTFCIFTNIRGVNERSALGGPDKEGCVVTAGRLCSDNWIPTLVTKSFTTLLKEFSESKKQKAAIESDTDNPEMKN